VIKEQILILILIAASNIRCIQPPYHAAARRSTYALPTSPTKCILSEAGVPSITNRIKETTSRLILKLFTIPNIFKERRSYKCSSTIRICAISSKEFDLPPPEPIYIVRAISTLGSEQT